MNFAAKLQQIQSNQNSLLCIGLDTDPSLLPSHLGHSAADVVAFNRQIVKATSDLVCAYKINLGFYEALGNDGWPVMRQTLSFIPSSVLTIGDAKRGDIGNTAKQYARSLFDDLGFGAATVSPLMGKDSLEPFLSYQERGTFVLTLTSNPGSKDFLKLPAGSSRLYERIANKARRWNESGNVGLVVGATQSTELRRIRGRCPGMPILIPGIGAQGGDLRQSIKNGCDADGYAALINVSRAILYASHEPDFAAVARSVAQDYRDRINRFRAEFFSPR